MPARLTVEAGSASLPFLDLVEGQTYTIGRSSASSLCLKDRHASRDHAVLSFTVGSWLFHDLGPTNGTRIDTRRVEADTPLADGQMITIGDVRLRFRADTEDDSDQAVMVESASDAHETTYFEPDELTALLRFTSAALAEETTQALVGRALDTLLRQTLADFAGYLGLDPDHPESRQVRPEQASVDVRLSQQLTQAVLRQGRLVWLGSEDAAGLESDSLERFGDAVCAPLRGTADRQPSGALHLYSRARPFTERQVRFC
ncbi:MAG: FHA domain-containing protein, partial [Gemmataceae bacterium]